MNLLFQVNLHFKYSDHFSFNFSTLPFSAAGIKVDFQTVFFSLRFSLWPPLLRPFVKIPTLINKAFSPRSFVFFVHSQLRLPLKVSSCFRTRSFSVLPYFHVRGISPGRFKASLAKGRVCVGTGFILRPLTPW